MNILKPIYTIYKKIKAMKKKNEKNINIPLSVPSLKGNELKYVSECIKTEWISSAGKYVERFETETAAYLKTAFCIAVTNGTSALHLALICAGVKCGEEVFVPSVTFIAPINAVKYTGAHPVFLDCDNYLNLSAESLNSFIEKNCIFSKGKLINKKTERQIKAVIPVHIFGHPADMAAIMKIAEKYNLKVIEDATESLGSFYSSGDFKGMKTGTIGDFGCFSFNGNKIITTGGGGMLTCRKKKDADFARYLSTQAKDDALNYVHNNIGYNYRLNNIQAAIGCAQLEKIDYYIKIKRKNFKLYQKLLSGVNGFSFITEPDYSFSNYWFYSLIVEPGAINNKKLIDFLRINGIESRPLWMLNHLQKPYKNEPKGVIKKAEYYFKRLINIPCSVNLKEEQIRFICETIIKKAGR